MGCCHSAPVDFNRDVDLTHFDMHRVIGKGTFGKVRVVQHKRSKVAYALKYINKRQCIKQKAVENIIRERHILELVNHPFLVNLRYAFQDDENCFYVLDLMLGGDLRYQLNTKGCFPEHVVRFWIAEVACGLAYLHDRRIIHRDIKPDNILLDAAGHAHITDLNVAMHCSSHRRHTSIAGTMAYMAPEILSPSRKGYYWQVDWWSLGVVAHELLWHTRPFEGNSAEKLTQSVLTDAVVVPPRIIPNRAPISPEGCGAVRSLLDRNPHTRLGCRSRSTSLADVKSHPWFAALDWRKLEAKELAPPYIPDQTRANFDFGHEMDEYMSAEKRLTPGRRPTPADLEKMSPEQRQLAEGFCIYDFEQPSRALSERYDLPPSHAGSSIASSRDQSPSYRSSTSTRSSSDQSSTHYVPSHSRSSNKHVDGFR